LLKPWWLKLFKSSSPLQGSPNFPLVALRS